MTIIEKPWGKEEILENNENYVVKRLTMNPDGRCSLQYHQFKIETIIVLEGPLEIYLENKEGKVKKEMYNYGDVITINPYVLHRMSGNGYKCVYLECSTTQLDDVVRIEDDYNRI